METSAENKKRQVIPYLSEDIIYDILVRIPAKQICVLKTVCKQWLFLISHPSFIAPHLHHSRLSNPNKIILTTFSKSRPWNLRAPDSSIVSINLKAMRVENFRLNFPIPGLVLSVKASCDGLLLLCDQQMRLYVHNPVTAMYKCLPDQFAIVKDEQTRRVRFMFPGFQWTFFHDTRVGKYKVCGFVVWSGLHCLGILLTLGEDRWTKFPDKGTHINSIRSGSFSGDPLLSPIFVDNKLHWLKNHAFTSSILWMDIHEIEFGTMDVPVEKSKQRHFLSTVKGSLCLMGFSFDRLDIFVLEDRDRGTWIKRYSITHSLFSDLPTFHTKFSRGDFCVIIMRDFDGSDLSDLMKILMYEEDQLVCYSMEHQEPSVIANLSKEHCPRRTYHFYSATLVQL